MSYEKEYEKKYSVRQNVAIAALVFASLAIIIGIGILIFVAFDIVITKRIQSEYALGGLITLGVSLVLFIIAGLTEWHD